MYAIRSLFKCNLVKESRNVVNKLFDGGLSLLAVVSANSTKLAWVVFLLVVIFAWHESHFQYDRYLPDGYGLLIHRLSVVSFLLVLSFSWVRGYPKFLVTMVFGYIALVVFYGFLNELVFDEGKFIYILQAIGFSLMMLPIISNRRRLYTLIRVSFLFGMVLVVLTSVPVLHWLNILSLPNKEVLRWGGEEGLYEFPPLFFGLFGLTESFPYPNHPFGAARLQGFSFEPIHWAYFVFLTLANGLFLVADRNTSRINRGYLLAFSLIGVHLFFVYSVTAFATAMIWLCILMFVFFVRKCRRLTYRTEATSGMLLAVIIPGLLIPFMLALIPQITFFLEAGNILSKGGNWQDKISFVSLGASLYARILPDFSPVLGTSHNLVLSTYVQYGYIFLLPLLVYLWMLIKTAFAGKPFAMLAATTLIILTHTFVVPGEFFWASGSLTILTAVGVAFHARQCKIADGHLRTSKA